MAAALPDRLNSGRVLIVKTSSMGDVVHAAAAVTDIRRARPGIAIDWLVESAFAPIARMHPAVSRTIAISWRKWRRSLWKADTRSALAAARAELRQERYDLVLDLQGLLKSVLWGVQARGPLVGYSRDSVREPLAALAYARVARVSRELHAVERCRRLAAMQIGYETPLIPPRFGLIAPTGSWTAPVLNAVLIPNASRPEKLWPQDRWIALGQRLARARLKPVVLWGSEDERGRAEAIAAACDGLVPPYLSVGDMACVLSRARQIVGLDTGFTHLGAAFGVPTIGIYCDHEPGLAGVTGPGRVASFGGVGRVPALDAVLAQLDKHLR